MSNGGVIVDLNADVGERFGPWRMGDDAALLGLATSANVACGFHAGDPATMRRTCEQALARGVRIGAHVGYQDLAGFGRRRLDVPPAQLLDEVAYQLGALVGCARVAGGAVGYVKPHGALYHRCASDPEAAAAVVSAIQAVDASLRVVGPPRSALLTVAAGRGLLTAPEGFADRAYEAGGLAPRNDPHALLSVERAAEQARQIAAESVVVTHDGRRQPLAVRTLCVHGDTPDAVALLSAVRIALEGAGVILEPFS